MATGRQARTDGDNPEAGKPVTELPVPRDPAMRFPRGTCEHPRIELESASTDLESADDAVLLVGEDGKVTALNRLAETMLGFDRRALIGTPIGLVLRCSTVERGAVHEYGAELGRELGRLNTRVFARHKCGLQIPVDLALDESNPGVVAITLRTRRERRTSSVEVRVDDIAALSRDLKVPLSVIDVEIGALNELESRAEAKLSLARIARSVATIERLLDDMVDFSLVEANRFALERADVDLVPLLRRAAAHFHVPLEGSDGSVVRGDARRIERVVATLLEHVLRHATNPLEVTIRHERGPGITIVSVIDHLPRLAAERKLAFHAFRGSHRAGHNTNVGLFVSRAIVEEHGGRIGVDTVAGGCSRFYFELPTIR